MFVPVPTILDFNTFNQSLFDACEKDAKREHYIKKMSIETLFQEDIQEMLPLNEIPYEIFILEPRKTDNYAKVTFDNNLYSTSPKYAKEEVYIKASSDKVWILNNCYEVIMEHPRLYGKGKESMNWLPYILDSRYTHDEVGNFTPSASYISICLLRSSPILGEWLASSKYSITSSLSSN